VLIVMTAMSFAVFSVLQDTRLGFAVNELLDVRIPARETAAAAERVRAVGGVTHVALSSPGPGGGASALASTPGRAATAVSIVEAASGFFDMSRPEWGLALIGLCGAVAFTSCLLATYRIVTLDPSVVLRRL
jgi:hypothetical protein